MAHSILLTGPDRRRSWSEAERREILAEAFAPGAIVAAVARRREVSTGLIYTWRRNAMRESGAPFLRALVADDQPPADKPTPQLAPAIVVDLPGGARVSISASACADLIVATLRGLR
jgi:transposase